MGCVASVRHCALVEVVAGLGRPESGAVDVYLGVRPDGAVSAGIGSLTGRAGECVGDHRLLFASKARVSRSPQGVKRYDFARRSALCPVVDATWRGYDMQNVLR